MSRNRLADEASPYLLQHAQNPVHWRPWGQEAFNEARARDLPVLLSVGYAACHWCHVMAHESFEDQATAAQMNANFVNVKVDREERPDVDHHYMSALHAMGEQGGWPLTMFLGPDGKPFFGGTYWPPAPRWGRASFRQVLTAISAAWRDRRAELMVNGEAVETHLRRLSTPEGAGEFDDLTLDALGEGLLGAIDPVHGGIDRAPKFPNAPIFRFFHNEFFRRRDPRFRAALRGLLDALCAGGIYDHLGGGFARYSTDAEWHVPHFEKMLYDNAQILELLALAHAETPSPVYAERARETFAWLIREMRVGDAFAASLDADSEGEEGTFYVWSEAEIKDRLGAAAPAFVAAYDVRAGGNWEGRNVLRRVTARGDDDAEAALALSREILFAARARRPRPALDDKILADWNGLAITALARASFVFDAPQFLEAARGAYAQVRHDLGDPRGRLVHSARAGRIGAPALLDDYAAFARAALALFEATGEPPYLDDAVKLAHDAQARFGAEDGGFYLTASDAPDAPSVRSRLANDGATPSGVGLLAEVFVKLYHLTDAAVWRLAAEKLVRAFAGAAPRQLTQRPLLMFASDALRRGGCIVVEGPLEAPEAQALAREALSAADPALSVFRLDRALWPSGAPGGRPPLPQTPAAMLCRGQTCGLPARTPSELKPFLTSP